MGMPEIKSRITEEIKAVEEEIEVQKRVIKHNANNSSILQSAEQNLKGLHTRLGVLQSNLEKCASAPGDS